MLVGNNDSQKVFCYQQILHLMLFIVVSFNCCITNVVIVIVQFGILVTLQGRFWEGYVVINDKELFL